ncbi:isochorismatase hydrolase [Lecanosticta acicola]|uniref:Isochorismatase hydrolase n=1 Tax=Lecanosticta acicola TaxID=111012 RepID=A0AAI9EFB7_9PEZI|nr:isochorismatase hydrolase [Lecanosticta acicola]
MSTNGTPSEKHAIIGNDDNFWLYSSKTGFDLTHPPKPDSPPVQSSVTLETTSVPITIDPSKSALIVIDMQNFFLSAALGRARGAGHEAMDQLMENAIPACRKAGIRVVWVNWGLTEKEIVEMPPAIKKAFGFKASDEANPHLFHGKHGGVGTKIKSGHPEYHGGAKVQEDGEHGRIYTGVGSDMGTVKDPETGEEISAGKMLMRDQWNAGLCPPLDKMFEEGTRLSHRPDVWVHKNRMSGMWGPQTELERFLQDEGIRTLLFTGVNTDQCVGGTYQDCFSKGYDCVLLSDGCGTTSPPFSQQCIEWNSANTCGVKGLRCNVQTPG